MGLLEEFHAVVEPGNAFIFCAIWPVCGRDRVCPDLVSEIFRISGRKRILSWGIEGCSLALGIWAIAFPEYIPVMLREDAFTPTAVAPQSFACIAVPPRPPFDLRRSTGVRGSQRRMPFGIAAFLFALAEGMFIYSTLWDADGGSGT